MATSDPRDFLKADRKASVISAELRREFEVAYRERYGDRSDTDPMVAVLMQAVASQVARVYSDAQQVFPERVIDDLIASLGLPTASAVPAQAVVGFREIEQRETLPTDLPLVGYARTGEEIRFLPDHSIDLVPATLRFAGVLENGRLHAVAGASLDREGTPMPVGSVGVASRRAPMLLLAIESSSANISQLGLHIDASPLEGAVGVAIGRSPWHLLDAEGRVHEAGTLVSHAGRGGVRHLNWVRAQAVADPVAAANPADMIDAVVVNADIAEGPYGHQVFVLPDIPSALRVPGMPPMEIRSAVRGLLPDEARDALDLPLFWIAIALPAGLANVAGAVQGVTLNAVTVSNIEILSQHLSFVQNGMAVFAHPESQSDRFLLGVQSVLGQENVRYAAESDVDAPPNAGRYRIDRNRVTVYPARTESGRLDRYADLRLLFTDGKRGNGVDTGRIVRLAGRLTNPLVQVSNLTPSRAGANPPTYDPADLAEKPGTRDRLAEALRSRERAITSEDFDLIAKAVEPRIKSTAVEYIGSVVERRLQPVHVVRVTVSARDFGDPDTEFTRLRSMLERHLQQRILIGHVVRVEVEVRP